MKRIKIESCKKDDCTDTGYDYSIGRGRDGTYYLYANYHTRWSGGRCGREYRCILSMHDRDTNDMADIIEQARDIIERVSEPHDNDNDQYAIIGDMVGEWELTKKGTIIR